MGRDEALRILREHRAELDRMGVRSPSLFGSVAGRTLGYSFDSRGASRRNLRDAGHLLRHPNRTAGSL